MPEYINPNGGKVRIASTSGHVVFVGEEPINILPHMESEARAKGCLPLSSYRALEEKIKLQMAGNQGQALAAGEKAEAPPQAAVAGATPATDQMTDEQKLQKVVESLNLMLDAEDDNYFTGQGLPRAAAVSDLAGFEVGKELREKAWEMVKKEAAK